MPRLRLWIAGRPGRSSRGLAYNHYVSKPIRVKNWRAALAGVFLFGVALTHRLYGGFKMKVILVKPYGSSAAGAADQPGVLHRICGP